MMPVLFYIFIHFSICLDTGTGNLEQDVSEDHDDGFESKHEDRDSVDVDDDVEEGHSMMIDTEERCLDIDLQEITEPYEDFCNQISDIVLPSALGTIWNGMVGRFVKGIIWMAQKLPAVFKKCIHFFIRFLRPKWFYSMQRTAYVCMVALGIIFTRNHISIRIRDVICKLISIVFGLIGCSDFFPSSYHLLLSRFNMHKQLDHESDKYYVLCSNCATPYKHQDCIVCGTCKLAQYQCTCLCVKCQKPHHVCLKVKKCKKQVALKQFQSKICMFEKYPKHTMEKFRGACNVPLLVRVKLSHSMINIMIRYFILFNITFISIFLFCSI